MLSTAGKALLIVLAALTMAASPARNGVPTLFGPVMTDGTGEFTLYAFDPDGVGGTLELVSGTFGDKSPETTSVQLGGDPVTVVPIDPFGQGTVFATPPPGVHLVPFNQDGNTSFSPFALPTDGNTGSCSAPYTDPESTDFDILNPGPGQVNVDLCADDASGGFQGCTTVNMVPGTGGDTEPLGDTFDPCQEEPCMGRTFGPTGRSLGCSTWSDESGGVELFGGFNAGDGADELFVLGDDIIVGNLGSTPGSVQVDPLDGGPMEGLDLDPFGNGRLTGGPGFNEVIFSDGFESGDTSAWGTLGGAERQGGTRVGPVEGFRGISAADGGHAKAAVVFPADGNAITTQFGAINMGKKRAKLTIRYFSPTGTKLGKKKVKLKGRTFVELALPSKVQGVDGAWADVKIKGKRSAVWPYARLTHTVSGDVTIVPGVVIR